MSYVTRCLIFTHNLAIFAQANQGIQNLIASPPSNLQQYKSEIQGIINQLRTVKSGTTAYTRSQQLLMSAQNKLK